MSPRPPRMASGREDEGVDHYRLMLGLRIRRGSYLRHPAVEVRDAHIRRTRRRRPEYRGCSREDIGRMPGRTTTQALASKITRGSLTSKYEPEGRKLYAHILSKGCADQGHPSRQDGHHRQVHRDPRYAADAGPARANGDIIDIRINDLSSANYFKPLPHEMRQHGTM